ncbi:MAG: c-type cytochrome [Gallionella sp.]
MMKKGEKILFGVVAFLVVVTVINFTVLENVSHNSDKPLYPILTHYDFSPAGMRGYSIYEHDNCYDCHKAVGSGTSMGVTLDGLGSEHDVNYFYNFLKFPEKTYGARTLDHGAPPKDAAYVSSLPDSDLHDIAIFLSELKSDQGSSSSFEPPKGESSFIDTMVDMWTPAGWRSKYRDIRDWMKSKSQEDKHDGKQ